jgi:phospholipase C
MINLTPFPHSQAAMGDQHEHVLFAPGVYHTMFDMADKDDETKNTHLWLVNRSTEVASQEPTFGNDIKTFMSVQASWVRQGLWDADNKLIYNNNNTYASHFYNPQTGKNYLNQTDPTALTQCKQFFEDSLRRYWNGNFAGAGYDLGLSLHYLTDTSQPMHAGNFTNISSPIGYHAGFESYIIDWTNNNGKNMAIWPYKKSILSDDPNDYSTEAGNRALQYANSIFGKPTTAAWSSSKLGAQWKQIVDPAIGPILQNCIDITSQFLVVWMKMAEKRHVWLPQTIGLNEDSTIDLMTLKTWDYEWSGGTPYLQPGALEGTTDTTIKSVSCVRNTLNGSYSSFAGIGQCFELNGPSPQVLTIQFEVDYEIMVACHDSCDGQAIARIGVVPLMDLLMYNDFSFPTSVFLPLFNDFLHLGSLTGNSQAQSHRDTSLSQTGKLNLLSNTPYVFVAIVQSTGNLGVPTVTSRITFNKVSLSAARATN